MDGDPIQTKHLYANKNGSHAMCASSYKRSWDETREAGSIEEVIGNAIWLIRCYHE